MFMYAFFNFIINTFTHSMHIITFEHSLVSQSSWKYNKLGFDMLPAKRTCFELIVSRTVHAQTQMSTWNQHHRLLLFLTDYTQALLLLIFYLVANKQCLIWTQKWANWILKKIKTINMPTFFTSITSKDAFRVRSSSSHSSIVVMASMADVLHMSRCNALSVSECSSCSAVYREFKDVNSRNIWVFWSLKTSN